MQENNSLFVIPKMFKWLQNLIFTIHNLVHLCINVLKQFHLDLTVQYVADAFTKWLISMHMQIQKLLVDCCISNKCKIHHILFFMWDHPIWARIIRLWLSLHEETHSGAQRFWPLENSKLLASFDQVYSEYDKWAYVMRSSSSDYVFKNLRSSMIPSFMSFFKK